MAAYKAKLKALRGIPAAVRTVLEALPAGTHPMDVMRTAVSALGCALPEREDHNHPGARDITDRLMASLGSMLLYWHHYAQNGRRIETETDDASIGAHFLHLLHGERPSPEWERAMHTSLILYAEHEFNASTFTTRVVAGTGSDIYSAITAGIGALRGPKHGGANEAALDIQARYTGADEAERDIRARVAAKEVVIGFGHPVYTIADPRNVVIKEVARRLSEASGNMRGFQVADRIEAVMADTKRMFANLDWFSGRVLQPDAGADSAVHADLRHFAHVGVGRARDRAADGQQDHPARRELHGAGEPGLRASRAALTPALPPRRVPGRRQVPCKRTAVSRRF